MAVYLRVLLNVSWRLCKPSMHALPRPLNVPNKFEEKSDLRGVGSCGLELSTVCQCSIQAEAVVPLIDVEVLRQIGSKTCCWRRSAYRFETEVVRRCLRHAQVLKVEV